MVYNADRAVLFIVDLVLYTKALLIISEFDRASCPVRGIEVPSHIDTLMRRRVIIIGLAFHLTHTAHLRIQIRIKNR